MSACLQLGCQVGIELDNRPNSWSEICIEIKMQQFLKTLYVH